MSWVVEPVTLCYGVIRIARIVFTDPRSNSIQPVAAPAFQNDPLAYSESWVDDVVVPLSVALADIEVGMRREGMVIAGDLFS